MVPQHLEKVYEQYWLHARHQENQRLWFTNIYAVIVAGLLAYIGVFQKNLGLFPIPYSRVWTYSPIEIVLVLFLTILSILGYVATHSWNIPFAIFSRLAEEIAVCEWGLPAQYQRFSRYRTEYRHSKEIGFGRAWVRTSAARAFMAFYSLMIGVFGSLLFLLAYTIMQPCLNWEGLTCSFASIAVALFIAFYTYYASYLEPRTLGQIQDSFEKRIQECSQKKASSPQPEKPSVVPAI